MASEGGCKVVLTIRVGPEESCKSPYFPIAAPQVFSTTVHIIILVRRCTWRMNWLTRRGGRTRRGKGDAQVLAPSVPTVRGQVRLPLLPGGPHRFPHYVQEPVTPSDARMERGGATPYLFHLIRCLSLSQLLLGIIISQK